MRTVAILGTRYTDFSVEEEVLGPLGVRIVSGAGASSDEIAELAGDADVILAASRPRFDAATIARLRCRGIVRSGVGVETIDLDAAREAGIWVARVADYGTEAVALHAVTLALAGTRRLLEADRRVRSGDWGFAPLRPLHLPSALVAGVLGFGRIGRRAAELLLGLGFEVVAHDAVVPVEAPSVREVSFAELLSTADVVTLHAPAPADGSFLVGAPQLASMRPGSVLVNTSRGSLIDEEALVAALATGRPGTACLDVYAPEPPDPGRFASVAEHVILTPHMAWYTEESEHDLRVKAAQEARRLLEGERPRDVVVDPEGSPE
ncbi:MAG TPA: C-terminal binding protein [Gaiellaceae bacterium]|nr:C-terminal binding protein [Gaiellaceae bacterium]